jgi:hypothetical protein
MSYTRSFEPVRFDPTSSTLFIKVSGYSSGIKIAEDAEVAYILPLSPTGNAPVGDELNDLLTEHVKYVMPESFLRRTDLLRTYNTVANSNAVYNLTSDIEYNEIDTVTIPEDTSWVPVIIFPDTTYTTNGTVYTRSVIASVGGYLDGDLAGVAVAGDPKVGEQFTTDPLFRVGRYSLTASRINNGVLQYVHNSRNGPGVTQAAAITESIYSLLAPEYIVLEYPLIYNNTNISAMISNNVDLSDYLHYFYVEHEPLAIPTTYARGWFQYS